MAKVFNKEKKSNNRVDILQQQTSELKKKENIEGC